MESSLILFYVNLEAISSSLEAERWCKIEGYDNIKNHAYDIYPYDTTTEISAHEH